MLQGGNKQGSMVLGGECVKSHNGMPAWGVTLIVLASVSLPWSEIIEIHTQMLPLDLGDVYHLWKKVIQDKLAHFKIRCKASRPKHLEGYLRHLGRNNRLDGLVCKAIRKSARLSRHLQLCASPLWSSMKLKTRDWY